MRRLMRFCKVALAGAVAAEAVAVRENLKNPKMLAIHTITITLAVAIINALV